MLGTNEAGSPTAATWLEFEDGDTAQIVYGGGNGAWMLVSAVRTDRWPEQVQTADVDARLVDVEDGTVWAQARFVRRPLVVEDGYQYLLNTFLIVPSDGAWEGRDVRYRVTLSSDAAALRLEGERVVRLSRQ